MTTKDPASAPDEAAKEVPNTAGSVNGDTAWMSVTPWDLNLAASLQQASSIVLSPSQYHRKQVLCVLLWFVVFGALVTIRYWTTESIKMALQLVLTVLSWWIPTRIPWAIPVARANTDRFATGGHCTADTLRQAVFAYQYIRAMRSASERTRRRCLAGVARYTWIPRSVRLIGHSHPLIGKIYKRSDSGKGSASSPLEFLAIAETESATATAWTWIAEFCEHAPKNPHNIDLAEKLSLRWAQFVHAWQIDCEVREPDRFKRQFLRLSTLAQSADDAYKQCSPVQPTPEKRMPSHYIIATGVSFLCMTCGVVIYANKWDTTTSSAVSLLGIAVAVWIGAWTVRTSQSVSTASSGASSEPPLTPINQRIETSDAAHNPPHPSSAASR